MQFIHLGIDSLHLILKFRLSFVSKLQSKLVTITRTLTDSFAVVGFIPLVFTQIFIYINHSLGDVSLVVEHKLNTQNFSRTGKFFIHIFEGQNISVIFATLNHLNIFSDGTKENLITPRRMLEILPLWMLTVSLIPLQYYITT